MLKEKQTPKTSETLTSITSLSSDQADYSRPPSEVSTTDMSHTCIYNRNSCDIDSQSDINSIVPNNNFDDSNDPELLRLQLRIKENQMNLFKSMYNYEKLKNKKLLESHIGIKQETQRINVNNRSYRNSTPSLSRYQSP
eukprot:UN28246